MLYIQTFLFKQKILNDFNFMILLLFIFFSSMKYTDAPGMLFFPISSASSNDFCLSFFLSLRLGD